MVILKIGDHDWSYLIEWRGYGVTRNDLDDETTTRTKNQGKMRRKKIAEKLTLPFKTIGAPREELASLGKDLSAETFTATVLTLDGQVEKDFYCSSFKTSLAGVVNGVEMWDGAEFTLIEV